jgi:hypothetical protein
LSVNLHGNPQQEPAHSAKVIWLKDKSAARR